MFSAANFLSMTHPEKINIFNIPIFHIKYNIRNIRCQEFEIIFFIFFFPWNLPAYPRENTAFVAGKQIKTGDNRRRFLKYE